MRPPDVSTLICWLYVDSSSFSSPRSAHIDPTIGLTTHSGDSHDDDSSRLRKSQVTRVYGPTRTYRLADGTDYFRDDHNLLDKVSCRYGYQFCSANCYQNQRGLRIEDAGRSGTHDPASDDNDYFRNEDNLMDKVCRHC
jgi:hypothetical protein